LRAIPDRARLADAGLGAAELGLALRTMYEGNNDAKFRVLGREYDVRVLLDDVDKNNPDLIGQVPVAFRQGNPIYLDSVARVEKATALDKVERRIRQEEIRITAGLLPGLAAGTKQSEIDKWLTDNKLIPAGVTQKNLGQADVQAREGQYLMTALVVGFVLVYALLASLYNNLLYPFIIQLAQPQAMIGAILALVLTDKPLTIVGFIGIIALVGLVGKNAILLVDYTNTLRERGMNREEAILEAGPTRLRPILMTSLAIILGMLPVALAIGRGSEFRETIGIIIIGGIALSTVLTLLVIPCSYTIIDDLAQRKSRKEEDASLRA
jgi:HAE1 family hydrophobic/amphiphilic exporter-1